MSQEILDEIIENTFRSTAIEELVNEYSEKVFLVWDDKWKIEEILRKLTKETLKFKIVWLENQLILQERQFKDLLNQVQTWIWWTNLNTRTVEHVNNYFCEMLGINKEDIIGNPIEIFSEYIIQTEENLERFENWRKIFKESGWVIPYELQFKTKTWEEKWFLLSSTHDKDKNIESFTTADITPLKKLIEALKEIDKIKENTIYVMNHDIKQPLTCALGFASILYDKICWVGKNVSEDNFKLYFLKLKESIEAAAELTVDYLDILKMELGEYKLKPWRIELLSFLNEMIDITSKKWKISNIPWDLEIIINNDIKCLKRIFINLFKNAFEAWLFLNINIDDDNEFVSITMHNDWYINKELLITLFKEKVKSTKPNWCWLWTYSVGLACKTIGWEIRIVESTKENWTIIEIKIPKILKNNQEKNWLH
ncbi:MAG: PAS/PAC sensor signal transduction histidine kinase [uncultured bacterium (gcode 4)]|uniref:histidine kinase n=1 Tax=uncultured bacterium (gcode 4) TaxID=1234023 RepID=K2F7Q3_9BACT|nr:MAG: PAS/PAC sensor signal transduction histidine kinase [uncultured bacterium (gcode 4)]